MATDRIKGITIKIGGDTTELDKSLSGVNKKLKSTQDELKDVEKLLRLDPGNTELLRQKQELLNEALKDSKTKLDELKKAEEAMKTEGVDQNSEQFRGLQREIVSTQIEYDRLKDKADSTNIAMEKISVTAGKVSDATGKVADATKGLATAATGVITALGTAAIKSAAYSDDLNTLAKQSGLSTSMIQEIQYASDMIDVSSDSIIGAMKKLKRNMDSNSADVAEAFARIGVATKDAEGNFLDSTQVFFNVLEGLSQIGNETERDIVSMQIFGKSADELAGIIDDGGEALRSYGEQAQELGLILTQDTLDSMNAVNDKIDETKAKAQALFYETGAKALEALGPIIDTIVEKISNFFAWIGNLDTSAIKLTLTISGVIAGLWGIVKAISNVTGMIDALAASKSAKKIVNFFKSNPWVIIIAGVIAVATAIYKNWENVSEFMVTAWENIKTFLYNVKAWLNNNFIKPVSDFFVDMINGIIDAFNVVIRALNKISIKIPDNKIFGDLAGTTFGVNMNEISHIESGVTEMAYRDYKKGNYVTATKANAGTVVDTSGSVSSIPEGTATATAAESTTNVNITFEGDLAQLGRVLTPIVSAEQQRAGTSLVY